MEDTNRAIDIAVGVIVFIIALSVNVFLYASINKSIKEVLSVNDTDASIIVTEQDISNEYVKYSASEIFFIVQDMIAKTDVDDERYIVDEYNPYHDDIKVSFWENGNAVAVRTWYKLSDFTKEMYSKNKQTGAITSGFDTYFTKDSKYKVEYTYEYQEPDRLNLSNHKILEIKFTKM